MSTASYSLLTNSTESLDATIPVKEPISTGAMNSSNDALKKRYVQIALAVLLYWYAERSSSPFSFSLSRTTLRLGSFP